MRADPILTSVITKDSNCDTENYREDVHMSEDTLKTLQFGRVPAPHPNQIGSISKIQQSLNSTSCLGPSKHNRQQACI